ncbi:hypothetical protein Q5O24_06945 [Eubacteriaceae bacterium ES3]|nr:hypothetical protein Q5O24_06945 [Eubacteriaceae bacterium ES3]
MKNLELNARKELCCIQLINDLPVLRARIGASKEDVASRSGISRQTYNSYETKREQYLGLLALRW